MKILVGFDGSNVAKDAIAIAEMHANAFKGEIILVHSMVGGPEVPRRDFEEDEKNLDYEKNMLLEKKLKKFYIKKTAVFLDLILTKHIFLQD